MSRNRWVPGLVGVLGLLVVLASPGAASARGGTSAEAALPALTGELSDATLSGATVDPPSPECTPRSTPIAQGPATLVADTVVPNTGGRLLHVVLDSPAMGADVNNYVLLPENYDPSGATRYPVLYLLHGAAGSYVDWIDSGDAESLIDSTSASDHLAPFITVMPDGGSWGFYSDWYGENAATSSSTPPPAYTTYDIHELIPWIDANFPTIPSRRYRAIAGLSMGGFGSMSYAARYPDLFSVAGSFSGAVDTDLDYPIGNEGLTAISAGFTGGTLNACVWGDPITDDVNWRAEDPTYLASNLENTDLFVASGDGVPGPYDDADSDAAGSVEAVIWQMNKAFVANLSSNDIPYTSYFYGPGTHSWPYWQRDLVHFLPLMEDAFAHPTATPPRVPFSYRTDQTTFTQWGWQFATDNPATEFTYLSDVDRTGLEAIGSGTLSVRTPALYRPHTAYVVTVQTTENSVGSGAQLATGGATADTTTKTVESSAAGELSFGVDLGAPRDVQQMRFAADGDPPSNWDRADVTIQRAG